MEEDKTIASLRQRSTQYDIQADMLASVVEQSEILQDSALESIEALQRSANQFEQQLVKISADIQNLAKSLPDHAFNAVVHRFEQAGKDAANTICSDWTDANHTVKRAAQTHLDAANKAAQICVEAARNAQTRWTAYVGAGALCGLIVGMFLGLGAAYLLRTI